MCIRCWLHEDNFHWFFNIAISLICNKLDFKLSPRFTTNTSKTISHGHDEQESKFKVHVAKLKAVSTR